MDGSSVIDPRPTVRMPVTLASPSTRSVVWPTPIWTVPTPVLIVDTPETFNPFDVTVIPLLAVMIPMESKFLMSSLVIVPPTLRLSVKWTSRSTFSDLLVTVNDEGKPIKIPEVLVKLFD